MLKYVCQVFAFLLLVFAEEMWFKCVSDYSNGTGASAAPCQVVVAEDVQRQQPVANTVLCSKTFSPMLYPGVHVPVPYIHTFLNLMLVTIINVLICNAQLAGLKALCSS